MKRDNSTKYFYALFIVLLIVQIMIIVFWGTKKENLYWDEFYTLERAHYFSRNNVLDHYIDEDEDYVVGTWMPISFVKDTLIVGKEETLFGEPFSEFFSKLTKRSCNYSAYLNLVTSIISLGKFSIWPSIVLNIIFFIMNQSVLFAMCKKIYVNSIYPISVCALYGFSSICVSMAIFIRFYMFVTFLVTLFTYLHFLYYLNDDEYFTGHIKRCLILLIAFGTLYLAYKNAQYAVIYGGIFVFGFAFLILLKRGIRRFLYYFLPMFGGGFLYLYTQTDFFHMLKNLKYTYQSADAALFTTLEGVFDFKFSYLPNRIQEMAYLIGRYLFGSYIWMMIFIVIVLAIAIMHKALGTKNDGKDVFSPFVVVSSAASIVYILLFTAFGLYEQVRYISFVFPELAILVILIACKTFRTNKYRYMFVTAVILVVILSVNVKSKVDMLYAGDRESIERIRGVGIDSYLLAAGNHRTFITYETAFVAEDGGEFFVYDDLEDETMENLKKNLRDKMILVGYYGVPTQDVQDMLRDNGYHVDWIADTYNYVFYAAIRD